MRGNAFTHLQAFFFGRHFKLALCHTIFSQSDSICIKFKFKNIFKQCTPHYDLIASKTGCVMWYNKRLTQIVQLAVLKGIQHEEENVSLFKRREKKMIRMVREKKKKKKKTLSTSVEVSLNERGELRAWY